MSKPVSKPLAINVPDGTLFFDGADWHVTRAITWYRWIGPIPQGDHKPGAIFQSAVVYQKDGGRRLKEGLR